MFPLNFVDNSIRNPSETMNTDQREAPIGKLDMAKVEIREIDNQPVDSHQNVFPHVIRIDRKFIDCISSVENFEDQSDTKYKTVFNEDDNIVGMPKSETKIEPDYEISVEYYEDSEHDMLCDQLWNHSLENSCCTDETRSNEQGSLEINEDLNQSPLVQEKTCLDCSLSFNNKKLLREHVLLYHLEKKFQCEKCATLFSTKTGLSLHKCYECNICGKIIQDKRKFQKHLIIHTHIRKEKRPPTVATHKKTCLECNISFYTKKLLKEHVLLEHRKKNFRCEKCTTYFSQEKGLLKHICYECNQCGKIMNHKFRFQRHLRIHIQSDKKDEKPTKWDGPRFECSNCSQSYKVKQMLKRHIESVHYGLKYSCPHCGKQYSTKRNCSNCSSIDEKETCPICKRVFSNSDSFRRHLKHAHQSQIEGRSRFTARCLRVKGAEFENTISSCLVCKERFTRVNEWTEHLQSESHEQMLAEEQSKGADRARDRAEAQGNGTRYRPRGGRTFGECPICNRIYSSRHKNSHMKEVHGIIIQNQTFHCNFCNEDFTNINDVVDHTEIETHKNNKQASFECEKCKKKFAYEKTCRTHTEKCKNNYRKV